MRRNRDANPHWSGPDRSRLRSTRPPLKLKGKVYIRRRNGTWDRERIASSIEKPLTLAKKTGLMLYCGEWGCPPAVPRESRLACYRDMVNVLDENGVGWSTWDYKGGFGLRKRDGGADEELVGILVP